MSDTQHYTELALGALEEAERQPTWEYEMKRAKTLATLALAEAVVNLTKMLDDNWRHE